MEAVRKKPYMNRQKPGLFKQKDFQKDRRGNKGKQDFRAPIIRSIVLQKTRGFWGWRQRSGGVTCELEKKTRVICVGYQGQQLVAIRQELQLGVGSQKAQ